MRSNLRLNLLWLGFFSLAGLLWSRLFYWQFLKAEELTALAESQHWLSFEIPAQRGLIMAQDSFPLAANQEAFLLFASLPDLKEKPEKIAAKVAPLLMEEAKASWPATDSGQLTLLNLEETIKQRLRRQDLVWVPLAHKVTRETKEKLVNLNIAGLGFEEEQKRSYPEGSAAAQLLGFVGADRRGQDKGYFGLEGYYDLELKGRPGILRREKDALGQPILIGEVSGEKEKNGRDLVTTLDRAIQFAVEKRLKEALKRYGAAAGSVVVVQPQTGAVLAMASWPSYDPSCYQLYDKTFYPNPVVAFGFEPGSVFKIAVMSAALNEKVVKPETRCDQCAGPRQIDKYTISTWNDKYFPDSTMVAVIEHSDNVGMVFVSEKLGLEKTVAYLKKFGLGEKTGIDLEDENVPLLRPVEEWSQVDLATASFGQGVAVTPLQMVMVVATIANQGSRMQPFLVQKVIGSEGTTEAKPQKIAQVITPTTARVMTEMMVNAVDNGEAQWAKPQGFRIAGKTGTAQIPVAGHYDEEKTIASFAGFAPADDPQFAMLVTLREPASSPWGSETAAPLWFDIAQDLFTYFGILPE